MNSARENTIPATERAWAYVALAKPDVTFLVVITTVAGFYIASRGPLDWALLAHTLVGTTLAAAGTATLNQYTEREADAQMRRTAARPIPSGVIQPTEAFWLGAILVVVGVLYLGILSNVLAAVADAFDNGALSRGLHAAQKNHAAGHIHRRIPWRHPAAHRLGRRARLAFARRLDSFRHTFPLAIPAFPGYRLDVPRRLRARGNQDAAGSRALRRPHLSPDPRHRRHPGADQPPAVGHRHHWNRLLLRRDGAWHGAAAGLPVGRAQPHQHSRQMADARHRDSHSDSSRLDDSGSRVSIALVRTRKEQTNPLHMDPKKNQIELAIISLFFLVLSLIGIVWCFTSGLLASGVDGILLVIICLMIAGVFALQIFLVALQAGWIKLPSRDKKATAAAKPAPAK